MYEKIHAKAKIINTLICPTALLLCMLNFILLNEMNTCKSKLFAISCETTQDERVRAALHSAQSNATYRVFNKCDWKMITGMMLKTPVHFGG